MDYDEYERQLFAGQAAGYERGFAGLTAHATEALLDAAGVTKGTRLLDVGAGPGLQAAAAIARGAQVIAVDAEPSMVQAAARNVLGLDVRCAVLPELPLPDGAFDAVAGNFIINAVGDPAATVAELRRVLRAGGRLALTCWRYPPPSPALTVISQAIEAAGGPPQAAPVPPFRAYSAPGPFAGLLREAGFTGVHAELLSLEHRVEPGQWWAAEALEGGPGGLADQDDATVARAKSEFDRLVAQYATGDGQIILPATAVLASGTR